MAKTPEERRETQRRAVRKYQAANPEKTRANKQKQWPAKQARLRADPAELARYRGRRAAYQLRPDVQAKNRRRHRRAREANPTWHRAKNKRWAQANPAKVNAAVKRWSQAHPEAGAVYASRHRARMRTAGPCDLTPAQWEEIKAAHKHRCVYCGRKSKNLTMDHVTPVVDGGATTVPNILPACSTCNRKKWKGAPLCPVQPLLLTIAPSKKPKAG